MDLSTPPLADLPAVLPPVSSSLGLSSPAGASATPQVPAPGPHPPRSYGRPISRIAGGSRTILTPRAPTVTLNRVQSGVGTLVFEAVCSPVVGDIRLGAVYELADGATSIVQRAIGLGAAPPGSRRPVLIGSVGRYDRLTVDLRQSRTLCRLLVYAFSESGRELTWGGTLVVATFGGARIELPLEFGRHHGQVALLSLYNVDGEFVLRAEGEKVTGEVREIARMFGYNRITWADDRTPAE